MRRYLTDTGKVIGNIIDAIAYIYVHTPASKIILRGLMVIVVSAATIGPISEIIARHVFDIQIDTISLPVAGSFLVIALLFYFLDLSFSNRVKLTLEPLHSFFKPKELNAQDDDPKYKEGNGFSISATVRIHAGKKGIAIARAQLYGFSSGLSLFATQQSYHLSGKEISGANTPGASEVSNGTQCHFYDGNYHFQPAIEIAANKSVELCVTRVFFGPFQDEGAPFDFRNAELKLVLEVIANGASTEEMFLLSSNYDTHGLTKISEISTSRYFSDPEIACWERHKAISSQERDMLLEIDHEVRRRIIHSRDSNDTLFARWRGKAGVAPSSIELLKALAHRYGELPALDHGAISLGFLGRVSKWLQKKKVSLQ